jgi:tRNA(adenine34) deaminase
MERALEEGDLASAHGDVPVGALVVREDGVLLASAHNERELASDPTAHAELLALRRATSGRGHWRFSDCTLYVTLEPCVMCAGALVNARIGRLVYGATDKKAGAITSLYTLNADLRLNHRYPVTGGVLAERCGARISEFFAKLRLAR